MANLARTFTDTDFQLVRGPYRYGEEHRKHRGWYFTGRYDAEGWPLFIPTPRRFRSRQAAFGALLIFLAVTVALAIGVTALRRPHQAKPWDPTLDGSVQTACARGLMAAESCARWKAHHRRPTDADAASLGTPPGSPQR